MHQYLLCKTEDGTAMEVRRKSLDISSCLAWERAGAQYSQGKSSCYDQSLKNDEAFITKNNRGAMEVRNVCREDMHSD